MVRARVLGFIDVLDEVVGKVLSRGYIGDGEDFRSGNSCVFVF